MTGGTLIYKCRLCGELNKNPHAPNGNIALICVIDDIPMPIEWGPVTPRILGLHSCSDGRTGVSDLVGMELDKELEG